MSRPNATPTVQVDDDRFRVTEWRFAPGAETGWHTHTMPYVVVPRTTGTLTVETESADPLAMECTAGVSYSREAGGHHNIVNDSDEEFTFVEVEAKAVPAA
ncbi:cupin [Pseudoclavibacter sp. AY1F1]|uniref:cupin domain-containing protein n=1 Tax=Pseudoclavibacter sp. AY1F1 TaxID=2080583 RepID=UPI000CE7F838|nr:cupin domain-containing protein [Pseudoclavibacter sp. AY1F1]PPF45995.1 cupin [Pseudoclavibacter sp. AY1F1]